VSTDCPLGGVPQACRKVACRKVEGFAQPITVDTIVLTDFYCTSQRRHMSEQSIDDETAWMEAETAGSYLNELVQRTVAETPIQVRFAATQRPWDYILVSCFPQVRTPRA